MIRYTLDLELEQPNTNPQTPDSILSTPRIIQIGVVFFNINDHQVVHKKSWIINIQVPVSKFIKQLTGITQEQIDNGVSISEAHKELIELIKFYKAVTQPITWGVGDLEALRNEILYLGQPWTLGRAELNIKSLYQIYSQLNGIKWRGGLASCMKRLGLEFEGNQHDALIDAENTRIIAIHLLANLKIKISFNDGDL